LRRRAVGDSHKRRGARAIANPGVLGRQVISNGEAISVLKFVVEHEDLRNFAVEETGGRRKGSAVVVFARAEPELIGAQNRSTGPLANAVGMSVDEQFQAIGAGPDGEREDMPGAERQRGCEQIPFATKAGTLDVERVEIR